MIPADKLAGDPSSGQGGVDLPISGVAASANSPRACAQAGPEYFNKRPTQRVARTRGQPPRLDAKLKALVVKIVARGMSRRAAARQAGIDHSTICRAAQRDLVFAASLKEAKRQGLLRPRLGIQGWRQAAAVLKLGGFDPQWTREEKELWRG